MCLRGRRGQRRPRSDCADAQSDQGLRCPPSQPLNTIDPYQWKVKARMRPSHAQDVVNQHILCLLEGTFSLGAAIWFSFEYARRPLLLLYGTPCVFNLNPYRANTRVKIWFSFSLFHLQKSKPANKIYSECIKSSFENSFNRH